MRLVVRSIGTAALALVLSACAPKLTDDPDGVFLFAKPWAEVGDCFYGELVTTYGHAPSQVTYTKVDSRMEALVGASNAGGEGLLTVRIVGDAGGGSEATIWAQSTPFGGDKFKAQLRAAAATCGGQPARGAI